MRRLFGAVVLLTVLGGCTQAVSKDDPDLIAPTPEKKVASAAWPAGVKINRNDKGEVVCPVMGGTISSPEKAVSYQDYEGVRYYFCCDMCPPKFKENPKQYAKK